MSATFDVDAWLDDAAPPTRSVTVYGRGDLVAELQDLAAAEDHDVLDDRLAGNPSNARIEELQQLLEDSALTLHVRGLLDREQRDLLDRARPTRAGEEIPVDEPLYECLLVEAASVDPPLTAQQAERMRERIGQAQWDAIFAAISAASKETIDVPLSRLGSGTGQDS